MTNKSRFNFIAYIFFYIYLPIQSLSEDNLRELVVNVYSEELESISTKSTTTNKMDLTTRVLYKPKTYTDCFNQCQAVSKCQSYYYDDIRSDCTLSIAIDALASPKSISTKSTTANKMDLTTRVLYKTKTYTDCFNQCQAVSKCQSYYYDDIRGDCTLSIAIDALASPITNLMTTRNPVTNLMLTMITGGKVVTQLPVSKIISVVVKADSLDQCQMICQSNPSCTNFVFPYHERNDCRVLIDRGKIVKNEEILIPETLVNSWIFVKPVVSGSYADCEKKCALIENCKSFVYHDNNGENCELEFGILSNSGASRKKTVNSNIKSVCKEICETVVNCKRYKFNQNLGSCELISDVEI